MVVAGQHELLVAGNLGLLAVEDQEVLVEFYETLDVHVLVLERVGHLEEGVEGVVDLGVEGVEFSRGG